MDTAESKRSRLFPEIEKDMFDTQWRRQQEPEEMWNGEQFHIDLSLFVREYPHKRALDETSTPFLTRIQATTGF